MWYCYLSRNYLHNSSMFLNTRVRGLFRWLVFLSAGVFTQIKGLPVLGKSTLSVLIANCMWKKWINEWMFLQLCQKTVLSFFFFFLQKCKSTLNICGMRYFIPSHKKLRWIEVTVHLLFFLKNMYSYNLDKGRKMPVISCSELSADIVLWLQQWVFLVRCSTEVNKARLQCMRVYACCHGSQSVPLWGANNW